MHAIIHFMRRAGTDNNIKVFFFQTIVKAKSLKNAHTSQQPDNKVDAKRLFLQ